MASEFSYTLKHPVQPLDKQGNAAGDPITTIWLKRPRGKEMRAMDAAKGAMEKQIALIAACAGLLPAQVDQFDGEDLMNVIEVVTGFLGMSLPTGGT